MPKSPFSLDHAPLIGVPERLGADLQVVTAPNAGPMTFTGTRTYILGGEHVAVIDPGPALEAHKLALLEAVEGRRVEAIVVTHSHVDHSPLAVPLSESSGAPIYGCARSLAESAEIQLDIGGFEGGEGVDRTFKAEVELDHGSTIKGQGWQLEAIHTPGHLSDHMCFSDGTRLFSGDHVMGWASSMISPPEGNLTAFMSSLEALLDRPERMYLPGHGDVVEDGPKIARFLLEHRRAREAQIVEALENGARSVDALTADIYSDVDKVLHGAASRNVLSHIIDLYSRDLVHCDGHFDVKASFSLTRNYHA